MKARKLITLALACLAVHLSAFAGGVEDGTVSAGLYNSPKGFGMSLDYYANSEILNSYTVYADIYGMMSGKYKGAGVKFVYLHYNRLTWFETDNARFDVFLGPGGSTGYVRDYNHDRFGFMLTADVSFAIRACFKRNFDIELANVAELGFLVGEEGGHTQLRIYNNGLTQALIPSLKLMFRF
ncbi:MAG: hypothetical protein J6X57_04900 [Bacteroidales bacterium]|nr:hypothetical protein [Bacteroidales bacterium]